MRLSRINLEPKKKARTVVRACQFIRWLINNSYQYVNEK